MNHYERPGGGADSSAKLEKRLAALERKFERVAILERRFDDVLTPSNYLRDERFPVLSGDVRNQGGTLELTVLSTQYVYYRAAVVQGSTALLGFSAPATDPATAAVVTTSNTLLAAASFADAATQSIQDHFILPDNWNGSLSLELRWRNATNDNTKAVLWGCETAGANDGATYDPSFNVVQTVTTSVAAGATRPVTLSSFTALTTTGLVAGKEFFWKVSRRGTHASDTLAESAELLSLRFAVGRA